MKFQEGDFVTDSEGNILICSPHDIFTYLQGKHKGKSKNFPPYDCGKSSQDDLKLVHIEIKVLDSPRKRFLTRTSALHNQYDPKSQAAQGQIAQAGLLQQMASQQRGLNPQYGDTSLSRLFGGQF